MLVILPIFLGVAIVRWNARFDAMLLSKADSDLTIAQQYLAQLLGARQTSLTSLAASAGFRDALGSGARSDALPALLAREARTGGFDFLYLLDERNRIMAASERFKSGAVRADWPVVRSALRGQPRTGIDLFQKVDLQALSPQLSGRAEVKLVPTEKAAQSSQTVETRGMVVHSATPVRLPDGRTAALVGGTLLNRNLAFIDRINNLVYHDASLPQGSRGTVSLLLGDVRISTNVRLFEGHRAIGTRVSEAVCDAVLDHGRTWLDSAFVVNDWYISAYQPIMDTRGHRIGMLYVGFLEQPFTDMRREIIISIAFAFLLVTGLTVPLFLRWATDIFRPLERMAATITKVETGDLAARTGPQEGADEIGQVAEHLDHLLDQVQDRDRQLREWNEELNARVEQRTEHLLLARKQVEDTTKQLVMAEKLATMGQITAGIAHEINNPLAVIQGNLEIIRDVMGGRAAEADLEWRLVDEQVQRISEIVRKFLQFAKPAEYAAYPTPHALPDIISDTLPLVEHLLRKTSIAVQRDDNATRLVLMNRSELQQVLVNLIANAVQAMPQGGTLSLRSFDSQGSDGRAGAAIEVRDSGIGMTEETLARIFDPFFTTRQRDGNGLGLSISQMLVSREGGSLSVSSAPGTGTAFVVWLPEATESAPSDSGQSV